MKDSLKIKNSSFPKYGTWACTLTLFFLFISLQIKNKKFFACHCYLEDQSLELLPVDATKWVLLAPSEIKTLSPPNRILTQHDVSHVLKSCFHSHVEEYRAKMSQRQLLKDGRQKDFFLRG